MTDMLSYVCFSFLLASYALSLHWKKSSWHFDQNICACYIYMFNSATLMGEKQRRMGMQK